MELRVKIPMLIVIIVLFSSASIIIIVERFVSVNLEDSLYKELSGETRVNSELIRTMMEIELIRLWEIANRSSTRTMDFEGIVRSSLEPDVKRIDSLDIGLVFPDGTTRYVMDPQNIINLGDRDYVRKAFTGGKTAEVLISRATGALVEMLASPILEN